MTNILEPIFLEDTFNTMEVSSEKVHIRIQVRNRKKCITTIEGLATDLDLKMILEALKKKFNCNGSIMNDETLGEIIQLQGDNRNGVAEFLILNRIILKDNIIVHGF